MQLQDHEPVEGSSIPNEVHDHNINKGTQFSSPTCSVADSFTTPQGTANENNATHTTESAEGTSSNSPINPQETSLMDIDEPDNKNQMSVNEMPVSSNAIKSNEIHLNIRLPDGSTLQTKFSISDTLSLVKNYVDENQSSTMGPYALAVPYPRKVFGEQGTNFHTQSGSVLFHEILLVLRRLELGSS